MNEYQGGPRPADDKYRQSHSTASSACRTSAGTLTNTRQIPQPSIDSLSMECLTLCIHLCAYSHMDVTWDTRKADANLTNHGVAFADAEVVLTDPLALTERVQMQRASSAFSPLVRTHLDTSRQSSTHIVAKHRSD